MSFVRRLVLLTFAIGLCTVAAAASTPSLAAALTPGQWQPLGEPGSGGRITALAISPYDANRILVGGDVLGVGLSVDGGASWRATTGFTNWEINDFTFSPVDPNVVWVGTLGGPYRSTDGGATWVSKRTGLPTGDMPYSAPVQKVLFDQTDPQHLMAFGGNQRGVAAPGTGAKNYGQVYESRDGGESWVTVGSVGTDVNILDVVPLRGDLQTLLVAARNLGVLRSVDGGRTWTAVNTGLPRTAVKGLAADPTRPGTAWAALERAQTPGADGRYAPGGIYKTADAGSIWTSANNGLPQYSHTQASSATSMYSVYRAPDGRLYTADQGLYSQGRFASSDDGASWTALGPVGAKFYPAGAMPFDWSASADGSRVIGGTTDSILGSRDRGATWSDLGAVPVTASAWRGTGFSGLVTTRVAFTAQRPGAMLLTAMDAGRLLRSDDGGASWTRPAGSWDQYGGAYDATFGGPTASRAYAVMGQSGRFNGILSSADGGVTWTGAAGGTLPARGFVGKVRGSVAVGSATGSIAYAVLPDGNVYRTIDYGRTWLPDLVGQNAYAVATNPTFGAVYVSTESGVYSRDMATGEYRLQPGSPTRMVRLVVTKDTIYAVAQLGSFTASSGIWRRTNGIWSQMVTDHWVSDIAVDPRDPNTIVYTTNDNPYHDRTCATGAWRSTDGGATFARLGEGLGMLRLTSVAFDPATPGRVVVGANGRGFWQITLP